MSLEKLKERGVGLCADSPFDPRFYAHPVFMPRADHF